MGERNGNKWPTQRKARHLRRGIVAVFSLLAVTLVAPPQGDANESGGSQAIEKAQVVREYTPEGITIEGGEVVGKTHLRRTEDGLRARTNVHGLIPGGVYTYWWIVIQDDGAFPHNWYVAGQGGAVARQNGRASFRMHADIGDQSIEGFLPAEGLGGNGPLFDPLHAEVHIEIAYHGQVEDAHGDLESWLSDFWTGPACPQAPHPVLGDQNPDYENGQTANAAGQPHCPVYIRSIFPAS